jgi:chemotaxis protein CheX
MDEPISQVFADSYRQVLTEIGFADIQINASNGERKSGEYLCTVGLTGAIQGYLVLIFSSHHLGLFAEHLNARFEMGQTPGDPAFMRESIAELANQLGGRSVMGLSGMNLDCLITPPTVISGTNVETMVPHLGDEKNWSIRTSNGDFAISVLSKKR